MTAVIWQTFANDCTVQFQFIVSFDYNTFILSHFGGKQFVNGIC